MADVEAELAAFEAKLTETPEQGDPGFVDPAKGGVAPAQSQPQSAALPAVQQPAAPAAQGGQPAQAQAVAGQPPAPVGTIEEQLTALRALYAVEQKKAADKDGMAISERAARRAEAQRREAVELQAQQVAQERDQLRQLFAQLQEQASMPNPEENIVEWAKWKQQQEANQEQQRQQFQQMQGQQTQQRQYVQRVINRVEDLESEFKLSNPDYDDAADHVIQFKASEFEDIGYPKPQAQQLALDWAMRSSHDAMRAGKNPAEIAFAYAKKTGWAPKVAPAAGAAIGQPAAGVVQPLQVASGQPQYVTMPDGRVFAMMPMAAVGQQPTQQPGQAAQQQMQQMQAGQAAATTLSGGGAGTGGPPTLDAILKLDGAAFNSASEKYLEDMIRGRAR